MKKTLMTLGLCGALSALSTQAMADTLNYNVINLSEAASQTLENDILRITLNIQKEGKDRNAITNEVTQSLNQVLAKIKQNKNIDGKIINRSSYPLNDYVNGKTVSRGWQDAVQIQIESKDFAAVNQLAANVQNVANIQNMGYTVSDSKRKSAESQLTAAAIQSFKERAQDITRSLGAKSYKIVTMDIGSTGAPRRAPMMYLAKASGAAESAAVQDSMPGNEDIVLNISGSIQVQGL